VIALDTNVLSELMRRAPEPDVVRWIDSFSAADIFLTAVTVAELMYGVARLPNGRRRREVHVKVEGLLAEDFRDKVLPFDALSATNYADIVAARERTGHQINMADRQIAAICRNWNAELATRNVSDFINTGIHTISPWDSAPL
jgi:predicted nucleic acid-binding protein